MTAPATETPPAAMAMPDTFRVGAMTAPGAVAVLDIAVPEPAYGEALVKIEATAICTWEQRSFSGVQQNRFPFVGGHETAGTIAAIGPGYRGRLAVGDRVALGGSSCGACHWCWTGRDRACPAHYSGSVKYGDAWGPGGFADYKIHPADGLFPVGNAPAELACLAEPLSCALHVVRRIGPEVASDALVIGAGVMGLMNVIALKAHGARVIVSEVDPARLELAKRFGADELVDASATDPVAAIRDLTEDRGVGTAIAAIGHPSANAQAMAVLAERGTFALFASAHPESPLEISPNDLHNREQIVLGTVSSEKQDFYAAARMIRYGLVDLAPMVQAHYPLAELHDALTTSVAPGTYRIVVTP